MAKPLVADGDGWTGLADTGKGTVAKLSLVPEAMAESLADTGKGTVAKPTPVKLTPPAVLPTLEKELWQSRYWT